MASITGALRKLYAKLGGTDSGTKTIAGMIDKVADVAGEGGGGGLETIPYTATEGGIALTMTAQQILDGIDAGTMYMVKFDTSAISGYSVIEGRHIIYSVTIENGLISFNTYSYAFSAATASDYPAAYID